MIDIYIWHWKNDVETAKELSNAIISKNQPFNVRRRSDSVDKQGRWVDFSAGHIKKIVNNTDFNIVLVTEDALGSAAFKAEVNSIVTASKISQRAVLPIMFDGYRPEELEAFDEYTSIIDGNREQLYLTAENIADSINLEFKLAAHRKIFAENKIDEFLEDYNFGIVTGELHARAKKLNNIAWGCYSVVIFIICIVAYFSQYFSVHELVKLNFINDLYVSVLIGLKGLFICSLSIVVSSIFYKLGKAYTAESIKIFDRIHAIDFGARYLQMFRGDITPDEVRNVFKDWNIVNDTAFDYQKYGMLKFKDIEKFKPIVDAVLKSQGVDIKTPSNN